MTKDEVIDLLTQNANSTHLTGMSRFGVDTTTAMGIPVPKLRAFAKQIKKDHPLAQQLWDTHIHEAQILATMIADPALVTPQQMDNWVNNFHSWDVCDQACGNLFDRTVYVLDKALVYTESKKEFVKRAGFVLMAEYAVHNKQAPDEVSISFLPVIERESWDERNFVKKAVNWALRQIGKRNSHLKTAAIVNANQILLQNTKTAKWIANNVLAELHSK